MGSPLLEEASKRVVIATVGTSIEPLKVLVDRLGEQDKWILISGEPTPESQVSPFKVAEELKSYITQRMKCEVKIVPADAFNFEKCFSTILKIVREEAVNNPIVSFTAGTNIMAGAALCACWMEGLRACYIQKLPQPETLKVYAIPKLPPKGLEERDKAILSLLAAGEKSSGEIYRGVERMGFKHRSTTIERLKKLEEWRFVKWRLEAPGKRDRRRKLWSLTSPLALIIAGVEAERRGG